MAHLPYENVDGSLMYAMVYTQPYIAHALGVLSRYMSAPSKEHYMFVKRVFRYLCGMVNFAIFYHGESEEVEVHGFVDSDWDRDIDGRK